MEIPKECYSCKEEDGDLTKCDCQCNDLYVHVECLKRFNTFNHINGFQAITCPQCKTFYGVEIRTQLTRVGTRVRPVVGTRVRPVAEIPPLRSFISNGRTIYKDRNYYRKKCIKAVAIWVFVLMFGSGMYGLLFISLSISSWQSKILKGTCLIDEITYRSDPLVKDNKIIDHYVSERLYGQIITELSTENYEFTSKYDKIECDKKDCPLIITKTCYVKYQNKKFETVYTEFEKTTMMMIVVEVFL